MSHPKNSRMFPDSQVNEKQDYEYLDKSIGDLTLSKNTFIDGNFKGKIRVNATLKIGKNGHVTGKIIAEDLILYDSISGIVEVTGKLTMHNESIL